MTATAQTVKICELCRRVTGKNDRLVATKFGDYNMPGPIHYRHFDCKNPKMLPSLEARVKKFITSPLWFCWYLIWSIGIVIQWANK